MDLRFVKCTMDDLNDLREVSKSTFTETFAHQNDPEEFEEHTDYAFSKQKMRFELLNPNSEFYFAYMDKELVGYFKINYNDAQTEHFFPDAMELERLYVKKDHQNQGIGENILEFVINKAKDRKPSFVWLGVWEENQRGIKFYERHGFKKFDTHPYFIGNDRQTDWLMKLNVA